LEGGELDALRVDSADHVTDDAALARGVHRLQHQQDGIHRLAGARTREQPLLQFAEHRAARLELPVALVLASAESRRAPRIDVLVSESVSDAQKVARPGRPDVLAHADIMPGFRPMSDAPGTIASWTLPFSSSSWRWSPQHSPAASVSCSGCCAGGRRTPRRGPRRSQPACAR